MIVSRQLARFLRRSSGCCSARQRLIIFFSCMLLNTAAIFQERQKISGTVISQDNSPVVGASIKLKGTTEGTTTDELGKFSISAKSGDVLVITSVGFESTDISIGTANSYDIKLRSTASTLEDVTVVAIGYGTLDKKEVSSAVTHLSSKDLLTVGGNGALMSMQGKVAGLSVVNTAAADPNSSPNIQLRGASSRSAGLGPLYVINGIPGGNIDNLNQNDIESIDVLKGGAASAIYGTRGSNGVILITTKKGSEKPRAFYDGYVSFDKATNRLEVLNRDQYLEQKRGVDFGGNTDWFEAVSREVAVSHKHTLQFSGGNTRTNYLVSMDYRDAQGLELRSSKEEYGARLNLNHASANNLYSVAITIAPRYFKSNNADYGAFSQSITLSPTIPVMDTLNSNKYFNIRTGFSGAANPVDQLNTVLSGSEGKYLDWSGSFKLNILKNLYTQITLGQQTQDFFRFGFTPSYNTSLINSNGGRNTGSREYVKNDQRSFEWIGNYSLKVKEHAIKLLGGYSYYYFNSSGLNGSNQGFPSDVLTYNNLGTGSWNLLAGNNNVGSYKNDSKLIGFFGRLNYDYDNRYYLSGSLRREGSSKFGFENKWGYFPAASVGWRISNEKFFKNISFIDELKFRADYGVTGNQDFGNYLSLDTYSGFGYFLYNGTSYQVWGPSQNTNYDLRWEKAINFNVGLDFQLFKNRIAGSVNYYIRRNEDLLGDYSVPIPPNVRGTTFANVGTMENSGFEIQLNADVVSGKTLNYSIAIAAATNDNKFVSFSNDTYQGQKFVDMVSMPSPGTPGTAQRLQEGLRIGSFYMLRSAGVDSIGRLLVIDKAGKAIPGNTAKIDDKQFVGNGLPKFTASFGQTITYKDFDLNIFLRGAFGYQLFNTLAFYAGTPVTQSGANVLTSAYDGSKYSKLKNAATYSSLSDYFLESGNFVKIDNITLGYTYKSRSKFLQSARIYLTGRNLYTFAKWTGGDPESIPVNGLTPGIATSGGAGSRDYYPSSIQLLAGLQFNF
jgi:TonB-linked SusC/RagA family outer membrane protein